MRVFIVEDDRLVRKGFISLMPWDQFGMRVVGEAGNGEDALAYLSEHEVDLLITDLLMPRMSGIDLIRFVRERYPRIWSVVLTFHQDFEYVQEALRLGAIDYIAKTELQQDKMEEVLGRINGRMRYEMSHQTIKSELAQDRNIDLAIAWILQPLMDEKSVTAPVYNGISLEERAPGIWLLLASAEDICEDANSCLIEETLYENGIVMRISGIGGEDPKSVISVLQRYRERFLFYEWNRAEFEVRNRSYDQLRACVERDHATDEVKQLLKESWSSLQWVINDQQYEENIANLYEAKLTITQLDALFAMASTRWERIVPGKVWLPTPMARQSWKAWKSWADGLRGELAVYLFKPSYSQEVTSCVWNAVESIHRDLSRGITLKEVAREVNISQSYLSQCFRDVVGVSFNEYVRQARMDWAKKLLADTNKPIYWIATQTGYRNEKYFSRVFKEKTGMLPSTYRSAPKDEH